MTRADLHILYVTTALRSPPWIGCVIRTLNICRQLGRMGHVTCIAAADSIHEESLSAAKSVSDRLEFFQIANYFNSSSLKGRILHKYYMHLPGMSSPKVSRQDKEKFRNLLKEHDLVWFHTPAAAAPFGSLPLTSSVMDLDDLMHVKLQLQYNQVASLRYKLSAKVQEFKWRRIEFTAPLRYTGVAVCSETDRRILGADNIYIIPNGFAVPPEKPLWKPADGSRIGFIGTLGYYPNLEGLKWFALQAWPLIRKANPALRFRIIGSLPPDAQFLHTTEGFEPLGYVQDPGAEFKTWSAMAVPLFIGGGTRIKILEAFSRLCPVISTSVGAYGLDVEDNKNILLADTPQLFAAHCLALCRQPEKGRLLAEEGWNLFTQKYTWEQIGKKIHDTVEQCLKTKS